MQNSKFGRMIPLLVIYAIMLFGLMYFRGDKQQGKRPTHSIASLTQAAEKAVENKNYKEATSNYNQISSQYPQSDAAAQAQFAIAELNENPKLANNKNQALTIYHEIAAKYPDKMVELRQDGSIVRVKAEDAAKSRAERLIAEIDRQNSGDIRYKILDWLVGLTGRHRVFSYALALLVMTLFVKFITTPLTKKQFKSMIEMQRIQPLLKELQDKYKDKPEEFNKRTIAFYKEHGVSPLSGCLPLLIQMPVLMALYTMINLYQYQFAKGSFLWIPNLSLPDMPLLLLYAASMYLSTKLTAMPTADPAQLQQQKIMAYMMPVMFAFIGRTWPSAFVLYWFMFNVFSTWQQYHLVKEAKVKDAEKAASGPTGSNETGEKTPAKIKSRKRSTDSA